MPVPELPGLLEGDVPPDPFVLFSQWYQLAESSPLTEPAAMTLATATGDGVPSARVVLLRGFDSRGFVFYTNYRSRKAVELMGNPRAALVFHWQPLARQVRVEGTVETVSPAESDAYFRRRPLGHQLSAQASPQSEVISNRADLEERLEALQRQFDGREVPRPEHWGGFRVIPQAIEFWQNRDDRLHDRLRYRLVGEGKWLIERLAP